MEKILDHCDKENKDKHRKQCYEKRKHFSPFYLSVDGTLGKEALVVLTNLIRIVAKKLEEPLSQVCGWFNSQIVTVVVRQYS